MAAKKRPISLKLFQTYAVFFGLLFSLLLLMSSIYIGAALNRDILRAQEQLRAGISASVESYFIELNDFSMTLASSKEFQTLALQELPETMKQGRNSNPQFTAMYQIAYKMIEKGYRIGIYSDKGNYIWMGSNYFIARTDLPEQKAELSSLRIGEVRVRALEENQLLAANLHSQPYCAPDLMPVISLTRALSRRLPFSRAEATLDVEVPYSAFQSAMDRLTNGAKMDIALYGGDGTLLYGTERVPLDELRERGGLGQGRLRIGNDLLYADPLLFSNLYMVSAISYSELYGSLFFYIAAAATVFILLNGVLLLVTYRISRNLTRPLQEIGAELERIGADPAGAELFHPIEADTREIALLSESILGMQASLKKSLEEIICLRSYEMHAKLLALQAQMQPHFLYNTLTNISAMAEDGDDDGVVRVCCHLTRMLRYVSEKSEKGVTVTEEAAHLQDYMAVMKERFPQTGLECRLPLELMEVRVPKLVIQPLVENSLKYCERRDCHVQLSGSVEQGLWKICVEDDGAGFPPGRIEEILTRCAEISAEPGAAPLGIDGMGLANIYIRLKLFYGESMRFQVENLPEKGCRVEIGGYLRKE